MRRSEKGPEGLGTCSLRILFVDDEPDLYLASSEMLRDAGHEVHVAHDGEAALDLITSRRFDLVFADIRLPKLDGRSLARKTREHSPVTVVILVTAFAEVRDAVASVKDGADNYLVKPLRGDQIFRYVQDVSAQVRTRQQVVDARAQLTRLDPSEEIVGASAVMRAMMARLSAVAGSDASVLLSGQTGTGKELVARALHAHSPRSGKPFVVVNCPAFPEHLLEAELFGHERGAFTGAVARRIGRFQAATGGTLLLDEVGDMPLGAQAKLLRVLQEHTVEPLGANDSVSVDVRVISATHYDLGRMIERGLFREDLYYRLNVVSIALPPLRAREGDLALLVEYFLNEFDRGRARPHRLSQAAWGALLRYEFPGNVRQLRHAIQRAMILAGDEEIDLRHLPVEISGCCLDGASSQLASSPPLFIAKKAFEQQYIRRVLANSADRTDAATILRISRKTLWEKLRSDEDLQKLMKSRA
jgi:DNA-binding NtrC family response regulator